MAVCNKTGMISIYNSNENIFLSPQADGPIKFYSSVDNNFRVDQITKYGLSFSLCEFRIYEIINAGTSSNECSAKNYYRRQCGYPNINVTF